MSQHMEALARANEIRIARSALKRQIRGGQTTVAAVLLDLPPEAESMSFGDLLMAQHRWGRDRTRKFCRSLVISELRTLDRLTARERERILEQLQHRMPEEVEWAA